VTLYFTQPDDDSESISNFKPPSLEQLVEEDAAVCKYHEEIVEIEGVVAPKSQGGWPHSEFCSLHFFCFTAWRRIGQNVVRSELVVYRPVPHGGDWFSEFPKLSLQRIQVLLSLDETRAIFAGVSTTEVDTSGLVEIAEELARPIVVQTKKFGPLTLDRSIQCFDGTADWNGQAVRLSCYVDESMDLTGALKVAESLWSDQMAWKLQVDAYAVEKLLPLKNDSWLDEDEAPLTPEQFLSRMRLGSITIAKDGRFDFWHNDGDLFWGHWIQISGSLDKGLTLADIPG
jgi:hypothetical protein